MLGAIYRRCLQQLCSPWREPSIPSKIMSDKLPSPQSMRVADAFPELIRSVEALWGAVSACEEVLQDLINPNDGRLMMARGMLRKAAKHLEPLMLCCPAPADGENDKDQP